MAAQPTLAEHKNETDDYRRAKELRQTSSLAEQVLWHALRVNGKNGGFRFRRQHPLHPYIVDFICLKLKLVVELDGASHDGQQRHDARRDSYLRSLGYEVMRFTNDEILANCEGVVLAILHRVAPCTAG